MRYLLAVLAALALVSIPTAAAAQTPVPESVTISGLDLHDGTVVEANGTYYLYGTRYGCGFSWGVHNTPWCGFGVSTAPSLNGPWSTPTQLFNPSDVSPYAHMSFQTLCGSTGAGCFNPRMIQRTGWGANDGVWILWFNAPADYGRSRGNAYYAMGCTGPVGPCGQAAGVHASVNKPNLWSCGDNGDFSIVLDNPRSPMMFCTLADQTLGSERLDYWGTNGVQGTGHHSLAGATRSEAPGAYRDAVTGKWIMTFNELNCGYCAGAPTSYAIDTAVDGTFPAPALANPAWGATALGRRGISATTCGGQARTVTVLDGQPYQVIDLWGPGGNQTSAPVHLEPLSYRGEAAFGSPLQAFAPWGCG